MSAPLAGVRVLDLSRVIAGPLAAQILGDCGADVFKVEAPGEGDPARGYHGDAGGDRQSRLFEQLNRNKRSIELDLKTPAGADVLWRLLAGVDVLVHNFRPGVMERLGFGYSQVSVVHPQLVYCAISGYGDTGPLRDRAANDVIIQGFSGVMSMTGPVGGPPVRCGPSVADLTAGTYAAIGILAALHQRTVTGKGQYVRTSLLEGQLSLVAPSLLEYHDSGNVPKPMGSGTRVGLPNEAFPTSDGHVLIAAVSERVWQRLCAALSAPELAEDPRFRTLADRRRHRPELFAAVADRTSRMTSERCLVVLGDAGVPCGPINTIDQVSREPQVAALDMFLPVPQEPDRPGVVRLPVRFSDSEPVVRSPAPRHGEHTAEILAELDRSAP